MKTKSWDVYILLCSDNSLYTGISNNPSKRFLDHKNGKGARYTMQHDPLRIIHIEKYPTRSAAFKRELEIKSWTREQKIKKLNLKI
ncbi:MAG: hypothetical protein UR52_C0004G0003 [Candidatus Gottesmanbacteria bacterium GW2011_GWA1_34_13]|uniref:GIY-YIG domain-containing protein n=1 Tax=Candidatus Gottesmanbacteria bacterium GW2011_GWA1_34_13 TaxID=1618434 RepID=A0A0G0ARU7_9BACT|nr:MAG: hypothetical protein UR52_C0004G0003 [Candidatus Gottesmanbacteria bacterium GW2011_GWA1_34_13]